MHSQSKYAKDDRSSGEGNRKRGALTQSTDYLTPDLDNRFDRFCTGCAEVIENVALERIVNQCCPRCQSEVDLLKRTDDLYRACVRCLAMLKCTMRYCYLCGRFNQYYDPEKPQRLQKARESAMRCKIEQEMADKKTAEQLSQALVEDGEFDEQDIQQKDSSVASGSQSSSVVGQGTLAKGQDKSEENQGEASPQSGNQPE